ncbi:DUF4435 domain-containing protein [Providencia rettgeri]|uniref:DUF4435 domain-containing protein n=1 Tax=Providencia rettgeri TaxID=587 RepID=UPI001BCCB1C3|nr:DUF4435 domain-containing protein [Providencia rettgeri]
MSEFDNLLKSDRYLKAYAKQQAGKSQGILYVENPSDRLFWENVIAHVCPDKYIVKTYSVEKAPGKRALEKEYNRLNSSFIVGVDGDFDYLCPSRHDNASHLNSNPFIIHTFAYSRENIIFDMSSIADISNRMVFRHKLSHKGIEALACYSAIIFPALSVFSYAHNSDWQRFKEDQFMNAISLPENERLLTDELMVNTIALDRVKIASDEYIKYIINEMNNEIKESDCCEMITARCITPETAYMFINGHYLKDKIIKPMLDLLKRKNKNEDINDVKSKLPKDRWKRSIAEIDNYFKDCCNVECVIHNATSYTSGAVWGLIKNKLSNIRYMG